MEGTVNNHTSLTESLEESKFAAVVFHNIQEIYIPGRDIRCCYSIKPSVAPTPDDWIGLFKVGWQSCKDYLCYEYSPIVERNSDSSSSKTSISLQNSVLFRGNKLPAEAEDSEFYQFCYVTSSGEIRGASYPFQIQFSKPGELECNEVEDEDGDTLLVVRNRTMILEDALEKALDENSTLKASKEKAREEFVAFQEMILNLESQKNELVAKTNSQKKIIEKVMSEKTSIEESWKETVEKAEVCEEALKESKVKVLELQKSVEIEKLRSVQTDEDQKKLEEERVQLLQDVSEAQTEVEKLNDELDSKNCKILRLNEEVGKVSLEYQALVKEHENMLHEMVVIQTTLKETKQASFAVEKSLAEQLEVTNLLQIENSKLKQELHTAHAEIDQVKISLNEEKSRVEESKKEVNNFGEQVKKLMQKLEDKELVAISNEEKIQKVSSELEEDRKLRKQLVEDYEIVLGNVHEQLNHERAFNNSLCSASDRQVAELQEQLNAQLEKNSTTCQQIEVKVQEIKSLEEEVKEKEKVIVGLELQVQEWKKKLESAESRELEYMQSKSASDEVSTGKKSGLEGPYFALQTSCGQLKKQYLQTKKDLENAWRQKSDLKRQLTNLQSELPDSDLRIQMASLRKQIEDLRIRLNMGAEAYKAKFKECRKYENQLKKLQKSPSGRTTSQSPSSVAEFEIRNLKESLENEQTATAALKKSLGNYKQETHEVKRELEEVKKENEGLQKKVTDLEKEAALTNEEKQRRLVEDKELQSHIECIHHELQVRTEAVKEVEEEFKRVVLEKDNEIATWMEKNQNLQDALQSKREEETEEMLLKNQVLQEEVVRQKKIVEDLHSKLLERADNEALLVERIKEIEQQENQASNSSKEQTSRPATANKTNSLGSSGSMPPSSQNVCPVCSMCFPPSSSQSSFEEHVNSHFTD